MADCRESEEHGVRYRAEAEVSHQARETDARCRASARCQPERHFYKNIEQLRAERLIREASRSLTAALIGGAPLPFAPNGMRDSMKQTSMFAAGLGRGTSA
jgi:hypothetical protein